MGIVMWPLTGKAADGEVKQGKNGRWFGEERGWARVTLGFLFTTTLPSIRINPIWQLYTRIG